MADMFPDCVGEVDVVSDAENIKKLLKLPYSRGPVCNYFLIRFILRWFLLYQVTIIFSLF